MSDMFIPIAILAYLFFVSQMIKAGITKAKGADFDGIGPITLELFCVVIAAVIPLFIFGVAMDGLMSLFSRKPK